MKTTKIIAFAIICVIILTVTLSSQVILAENGENVNTNASSPTIIIDAGHGGEDGGASGLNGTLEKDLNLSVALILNDLMALRGYDTVMTRKCDVMLGSGEKGSRKLNDLRARLDMAQSHNNALFISIHMNKFPLEYCHGSTVYYSPNNIKSERIASIIKSGITDVLQNDNTREMKKADSAIYILNRITLPAVLVECGFLSNEAESRLLSDEKYRQKLSAVIACSLTSAIDEVYGG